MASPDPSRCRFLGSSTVILLLLAGVLSEVDEVYREHNGNRGGKGRCALFVGKWVQDPTYPLYQYSKCPMIESEFDCQKNGRQDTGYLKQRWQPDTCHISRFNAYKFLKRMRGKEVMFVGDSLGRNQWESLVCMLLAPNGKRVRIVRADPLSTVRFLDYGVKVSFYRAPYLVDVVPVNGKRVLRLGSIRRNAKAWTKAHVLSFNTGHWWAHQKSLQGWDYIETRSGKYGDMDELVALKKGLRTWAKWADNHIETTKRRVFFVGMSPTHFNCRYETKIMSSSKSSEAATYSDQTKVLHEVLASMKHRPIFLNITSLSAMRWDAHPSIYGVGLTSRPQSPDCSHWCLPGLPDTWNQLFYTALLSH